MTFVAAGVGIGVAGLGMSAYGMVSGKKNAQRQEEAIKAAIAERERKINSIYDRMGASGKATIERSTQDGLGQATQSAVDRGLGNTSVLDTMQGVARGNGLQAQLALQDQLARGRAGALSDLPIAVPDKPQGIDNGALFAQSLGQLGGLLNKIPGSNPNQTQNTIEGLRGTVTDRNAQYPDAPQSTQDAYQPPPPNPALLAGSPYTMPATAPARGVKRFGKPNLPYSARGGLY